MKLQDFRGSGSMAEPVYLRKLIDAEEATKHQLEYSIWSAKVSWCPICREHFYNDANRTHTTRATEAHVHLVSPNKRKGR